MSMDWDKLRIFHAVADASSFTSAGNSLNLSQSAVSRQISALEESLGVVLFHRHARGLVLTEQGEILKSAVGEIFTKLSTIEGKLHDTQKRDEGALTITVSDFIGSTWLAPKLKDFHEKNPGVQLTILFEDRILNLGMREADAAIRLRRSPQGDMVEKRLAEIRFHICASKGYLDKHGRPKNVQELKNHCLIAFPTDTYAPFANPNWLFDVAEVYPDTHNNLMMMNSMYAIHKAVKTGAGIAVLPDYLIKDNPDLEMVLPELERPTVDMFFTYPGERRHSKRIEVLRDFLVQSLEKSAA